MSEKSKFKPGDEVRLKEPGLVSEVATDSGKARCRVEWSNGNYDWYDADELTIKDPKAAIEAARELCRWIEAGGHGGSAELSKRAVKALTLLNG